MFSNLLDEFENLTDGQKEAAMKTIRQLKEQEQSGIRSPSRGEMVFDGCDYERREFVRKLKMARLELICAKRIIDQIVARTEAIERAVGARSKPCSESETNALQLDLEEVFRKKSEISCSLTRAVLYAERTNKDLASLYSRMCPQEFVEASTLVIDTEYSDSGLPEVVTEAEYERREERAWEDECS